MTLGFSFIIPTFNAEHTIERCISHIRSLSYPQSLIEIIGVDNGSRDKTPDLLKTLCDHWYQDAEETVAGLRNLGASKARNSVLVFVDADCLLFPNFATVVAQLLEDRSIAMVGAKTHILPESAGWVAQTWKVHLDRSQLVGEASWLVTRALAVRTNAFREVGGFDASLETCEDVSFGHSISQQWRIISDERLAPLHLEDPDSMLDFLRKEVWRAQNSMQISWKWIKSHPFLLLSKEGISFILPFYFLASAILVLLGLIGLLAKGSAIALVFALCAFLAPILFLAWDTARRAKVSGVITKLAVLYALYILSKVIALFSNPQRHGPRRTV